MVLRSARREGQYRHSPRQAAQRHHGDCGQVQRHQRNPVHGAIEIRADLPTHRRWRGVRRTLVHGICRRDEIALEGVGTITRYKNIECGLLLPILLYCADELAIIAGPLPKGIDTKSYLKVAYHNIPIAVPSIRDFWMPQRVAEVSR
jgi:hypothetical protein